MHIFFTYLPVVHLASNELLQTYAGYLAGESPRRLRGQFGAGERDRISACAAAAEILPLLLIWPNSFPNSPTCTPYCLLLQ